MAQFTKNLELDSSLASGIQNSLGSATSSHFDQRRTLNASGVVVNLAGSREYVADGMYSLADFYPVTFNATGILQVSIRQNNSCGDVTVVNAAGSTVLTAKPSKFSSRQNSVTRTTINASGVHYTYIELKGRSGSEYKVGMQLS